MNKVPPYNTGKVLIGCRYDPPLRPVSHTADDMALQSALLSKSSTLKSMFAILTTATKEKTSA